MIIYKIIADGNFYCEYQEGEEVAAAEEMDRQINPVMITVERKFTFMNDPQNREFDTPDERDYARLTFVADTFADLQFDSNLE